MKTKTKTKTKMKKKKKMLCLNSHFRWLGSSRARTTTSASISACKSYSAKRKLSEVVLAAAMVTQPGRIVELAALLSSLGSKYLIIYPISINHVSIDLSLWFCFFQTLVWWTWIPDDKYLLKMMNGFSKLQCANRIHWALYFYFWGVFICLYVGFSVLF